MLPCAHSTRCPACPGPVRCSQTPGEAVRVGAAREQPGTARAQPAAGLRGSSGVDLDSRKAGRRAGVINQDPGGVMGSHFTRAPSFAARCDVWRCGEQGCGGVGGEGQKGNRAQSPSHAQLLCHDCRNGLRQSCSLPSKPHDCRDGLRQSCSLPSKPHDCRDGLRQSCSLPSKPQASP